MRQTTTELARRKYERERREAVIAGIRAMRQPKTANPHDRRFDPVEDRVTAWQARYHEARRALGHRS